LDTTAYAPTTPLFLGAVRAVASEVLFLDEYEVFGYRPMPVEEKVFYRLSNRRPFRFWSFNEMILDRLCKFQPDVFLVVKGAYLAPGTLRKLKGRFPFASLVNFATDDPFNPLSSTHNLVESVQYYDLYACTKRAIMQDVRSLGCRRVEFIPFAYQPEVHFRECDVADKSVDVTFVGGADDTRIRYFRELVRRSGISLRLYGGGWERVPDLARYAGGVITGREYRLAHSRSKIVVGMVRHSNRDGHSMRSFEIPACGAFMLAERTAEHLEMFRENVEAAYFASPEEFVEQVAHFVANEEERTRIAAAGNSLVLNGDHRYSDRLRTILEITRG